MQKRPATEQIPGRKFSLDDSTRRLSRLAGQDNATTISPTSDHSGPACIGPGLELPASVAVPCGRKQGGPDRPLCQLSSWTTDKDNRLSFQRKPKETQSKQSSLQVQHRHPPHASHISTTTRLPSTRVDPAAMECGGHSHHLTNCTPHYQRQPLPPLSIPRRSKRTSTASGSSASTVDWCRNEAVLRRQRRSSMIFRVKLKRPPCQQPPWH